MFTRTNFKMTNPLRLGIRIVLVIAGLLVVALLVWQGITASGNPDPTTAHISQGAAIVNTGLLVFREGLEMILVLAAITASMVGPKKVYRRPVALGSVGGFLVTIVTWFVAIAVLSVINAPALDIQAATGLLAIIVLLVIMNWFFHKIYWTGWISMHNRKRKDLMQQEKEEGGSSSRILFGMAMLGFSSVYREGFEVVLFLQNLRLQVGSNIVLQGVAIGLFLTAIVGVLTFIAHHRLPYKKMLILTGALLSIVLVVMVGESIQEMQLAHWVGTTPVNLPIPAWMGLWFALFPNVEGIIAQVLAGVFVIGSYFLARYLQVWRPVKQAEAARREAEVAKLVASAQEPVSSHS
ncbi:hypothetical protein KSC_098950 [Ktedonobacter sp. SOSP1-52]|uniref:FTR1 family iron permease n=1 Tax=Ktedonobacter sp. SOSP1-52 TaxID=2778366 RepID=UPI0019164686|nr:FTR1 family protein [Ktedonobacter sp. SOSP1-52]GHO71003.1 hypothetical protein KSC_098950 [Ktedonobacter sp. SOSP1-52]